MYRYSPLHPQAAAAHHSDYSKRLALWQELLAIEKRLREIADASTDDTRLAANADMSADYAQRAAARVAEREGFEEL